MQNLKKLIRFNELLLGLILAVLVDTTLCRQLLAVTVDPKSFCQVFPLNSRCRATTTSAQSNDEFLQSITHFRAVGNSYKVFSQASPVKELPAVKPVTIDAESRTDPVSKSIHPKNNRISYRAADLQLPQASPVNNQNPVYGSMTKSRLAVKVDRDTLCRSFPLNSRCREPLAPSTPEPASPSTSSQTGSGYAVFGEVSTLGLGVGLTTAFSPNFNGRIGFNTFSFNTAIEETDVSYDADVDLQNISALVDWYPEQGGGFHLTGGLIFNDNKIAVVGQPSATATVTFNNRPISAARVGTLEGEATFPNSIAPYIGIGWGNPVRRGQNLSFFVNLGVMFPGSPQVSLRPTDPRVNAVAASNPTAGSALAIALDREERRLEEKLSPLQAYPVLSLGVSYQF